MSESFEQFDALMGLGHVFSNSQLNVGGIAEAHPKLVQAIEKFDPRETAAAFGAMLCSPGLQANCVRLEALAHLALTAGAGSKIPKASDLQRWFDKLAEGVCGHSEDPAEDCFVSLVTTPFGNFRVLEGIWEGAGFYLQRILNALFLHEDKMRLTHVGRAVLGLLKLSDEICERFDLEAHLMGEESPRSKLPTKEALRGRSNRSKIVFSQSDLESLHIGLEDLAPFGFVPSKRFSLLDEIIGNSSLERSPLIHNGDSILLTLPTAVSPAIRRFVKEVFDENFGPDFLVSGLAQEYEALFSDLAILGGPRNAPLRFSKTPNNNVIGGITTAIDVGRYLNVVFIVDELEAFEEGGLIGANPAHTRFADDIDRYFDFALDQVSQEQDFSEMLSILVVCGIGRAQIVSTNNKERANWRFESLSPYDFYLLSLADEFHPDTLFRLLDARELLAHHKVQLFNANGLTNLVAWSRDLEGHLVPHPAIPADFTGENLFILVEQNALRALRHEVKSVTDERCLLGEDGIFRVVRRRAASLFPQDNTKPLYRAIEKRVRHAAPSIAYAAASRVWWADCICEQTNQGARWFFEIIETWLPRIAPVLDSRMENSPSEAVFWQISFLADPNELAADNNPASYEEARNSISYSISAADSEVAMGVSADFIRATFQPENVAERALVYKCVEAFCLLNDEELNSTDIEAIVDEIVPNNSARQSHRFEARQFRDQVRDSIPSSPIKVDEIDNAAIRLGLGWRQRKRSEGHLVEGDECKTFLNGLVDMLMKEFRSEVSEFSRTDLVKLCIVNHEAGCIDRDRWKRTSRAIEALRWNEPNVRETILTRQHDLNGVMQASRLVAEVALTNAPANGRSVGIIDMSRLMSKALLIAILTMQSDAIHWGAMRPRIEISPLGELFFDFEFHESVVVKQANFTTNSQIQRAIDEYADNFLPMETASNSSSVTDFEFAFEKEMGAPFAQYRAFVEALEDQAVTQDTAVMTLKRSELALGTTLSKVEINNIVKAWASVPRNDFFDLPESAHKSDLKLGKFRRQISVLRRPLLQVDDGDDPSFIVAPGLIRDAFAYQIRHYLDGDFPTNQLKSPEMRKWKADVDGSKGDEFEKKVLKHFEDAGWMARQSVNVTEIFGKALDRNYGDVDVLAWRPATGQVLVLECKDISFRQTPGELAEQLADFQGEVDERGKRDLLRKHLDRVGLLSEHPGVIERFCKLESRLSLASALVFKNPVPMLYAWQKFQERTSVALFDELESLSGIGANEA